jgi:DNA-binding response OmpR family regulator
LCTEIYSAYPDENHCGREGAEFFGDKAVMPVEDQSRPVILLVEDTEETRYLLEKMLKKDGYSVSLARDEEGALLSARSRTPDLILMSLNLGIRELVEAAQRIRDQADLTSAVAVVIFCVSTIPESAEWEIEENIYATRPDNFDQLRDFLHQLLRKRAPRR